MGMLVDGKWHDVWYDTEATKGRFVRSELERLDELCGELDGIELKLTDLRRRIQEQ